MNQHFVLNTINDQVQLDRLLPFQAALTVVTPLIEKNDQERASALPLFKQWIEDRDQKITVRQCAWLWENFASQHKKELVARTTQWLHDPVNGGHKSPFELAIEQFRVLKQTRFQPWVAMKSKTVLGRLQLMSLKGIACVAVLSVTIPGMAVVFLGLEKFRPLMLSLIG